MTLNELEAELFQNVTEYLDNAGLEDYVYDICDVIEKTFSDSFFAPAPITLDTTPQN